MKEKKQIPFNRACFEGKELVYVAESVGSGHISGDGIFTKRCQTFLEERMGVAKVLLTPSCTDALEMTALLLDIQPGDEVIVPSFTFVSTVNAFVLRGAKPVFIDIRPDTMNLNEKLLVQHITLRTKAIVPVHYAGVGCEMNAIQAIAKQHGIPVVEDNAHGLCGKYMNQHLGTFGQMATQSFHETKNVTCGEGGALIINDERLIERAEIIREKGTNRSRFFRGQVDKYTWTDLGSSFLLSEVLAAFLYAQLEAIDHIQTHRHRIWDYYLEQLSDWAHTHDVLLPSVPENCKQSYHMFYILMPNLGNRQAFIAHLKEQGIGAAFHYMPLHLSTMGMRYGGKPGDCPVTEDISDRLVRLPFYNELTEEDQDRVITTIKEFSFR